MERTEREKQIEYETYLAKRRALKRKKRQRKAAFQILMSLIIIIIIGIIGWQSVKFIKGRNGKPVSVKSELPKKIVKTPPDYDIQYLTVNPYSRPGIPLENVNGVVVHYTANPSTTAQQNRDYFEGLSLSGKTSVSSHFVIGIEGEVILCIPCDEIAYASNERNADTISIECCIPDESGKFADATYDTLIHLLAWLAGKYDLETDDIIRHYDVTGKNCPKYYVEYESAWDALKMDVRNYIEHNGAIEETTEE